jgi:hypothetical protein
MKNFKLGKKAPRYNKRTLMMSNYVDDSLLPPIPASVDWTPKNVDLQCFLNDQLGDCTCAGMAHLLMSWSANAGQIITPTNDQVLAAYEGACGYNPNDPTTDQGGVETDVLTYWANTGIAGHKISGSVQIHPHNLAHMRAAIYLFGGVYVGVELPNSAEDQFDTGKWDVGGDESIDGGHCIVLTGFTPDGFQAISWGKPVFATNNWWLKFSDEAYCPLSPDWEMVSGVAPSGLNLSQLQSDMAAVKN